MRLLPFLMTTVLLVGCASSGGSNGSDDSDPRPERNRISPEELAEQPQGSAYDVVKRLRPAWLRSRGRTIGQETLPRVFVDGRDYGSLDALYGISLENIGELRFIPARDATTRFGTGYPGGIIEVVLKREAPPPPVK